MPSIRSRLFAFILRVNRALFFRPNSSIKRQRVIFSRVSPRMLPDPKGVKVERLSVEGIPAAWLIPDGADPECAILYLHGGGWVIGSIESHWKMVGRIAAAAGCRALLIEYRLAPENPFPAALDDCLTAYRWLLGRGYRPEKIVIAGDSAGGGLTASTMVSLRDAGESLPAAAVLLSPGVDLAITGESMKTRARMDPMLTEGLARRWVGLYLGATPTTEPLASPLYADLAGLPPMLIQIGTREVLFDDAGRFAERAVDAGVEADLEIWEGMFHVWQLFCPLIPESVRAVVRIGSFCCEKTAR